jgi:uncharacterized protein (DUF1501 family)
MNQERCSLVTRRQFLAGLGSAVTVAACGGQGISVYQRAPSADASLLTTSTAARPAPSMPAGSIPVTGRTLVVIELGGGNDSLSTVIPLTGRYRDLRPSTAIDDPIELDAEIGLHPELGTVAELFGAGQVAIVEGLGIETPDLSHFISMRRWWDGTDRPDHTGWLGRYLDASVGYDHVLAGISIGPGPSPSMLGNASFVVGISDAAGLASGFPWWVDDIRDFAGIWNGFAPAGVPMTELDPVTRAIATTAGAQMQLQRSLDPLGVALGQLEVDTYSLEGQLALAGALVASDVDAKVVYVHGNVDFDTHEGQPDRHGALMASLDRGLRHFFQIVEEAGVADDVVVMTTSEFGRRPQDNGGGTDHGTAGSHFVIGRQVRGGRFGESPSLERLDPDGNLIHTVDFRSLYAAVIDDWMEAGHGEILRGDFEVLPLFRA